MHVKRVRVGTPSYHKFKFKVNFQFAIKLSIKFTVILNIFFVQQLQNRNRIHFFTYSTIHVLNINF